MPKQIYIVRHGETDFNKQMIVQGSGVNSALNQTGFEQAASLFNFYKHVNFDLIFCSQLKRSQQTIQSFINCGISFQPLSELNEINWGDHEGKSANPTMKKAYDQLIEAWSMGNLDQSIPNGESAKQMGIRLTRFINRLLDIKKERILICSHGRAIRALICLMKNKPLTEMHLFQHRNTGVYIAEQIDSKFHFLEENIAPHLELA